MKQGMNFAVDELIFFSSRPTQHGEDVIFIITFFSDYSTEDDSVVMVYVLFGKLIND